MAEGESAKTIKFGNLVLKIADPHAVQPVSADLQIEARVFGNIVALSFATVVTDGDSAPEARVCSRIRLSLDGATDLRNSLDNILKQAMPGPERAN